MAWFDERDEQVQRQWHSRVARQRLDLSASVEETLSLSDKEFVEETDTALQSAKGMVLIPPRLSLQSLQLAVMRPAKEPDATANLESQESRASSPNALVRLAQRISSSLPSRNTPVSSIHGMQTQSGELRQPAQIAERPLVTPLPERVVSPPVSEPHTNGIPRLGKSSQRLSRRATKVRLEVAPEPVETFKQLVKAEEEEVEVTTSGALPRVEVMVGRVAAVTSRIVARAGVFEGGCADAALAYKHITRSSVVVVMLTSDPGPVVVQYVSLQPGVGFTVHLSAPTRTKTSFNYVILEGEPL